MTNPSPWKAPSTSMLPDFIICGAMKSGTSTVHSILNAHPKVFIPKKEIHFFDMDDHFEHNDFSYLAKDKWVYPQIENDPEKYWQWYGDQFSAAGDEQLIGEDSTCYLSSKNAAKRIGSQVKPIKTIVCLRQPSKRAYSQYWHMLRSGRAMFNFNDTISFMPDYVLRRSLYKEQLDRFFQYIPKENSYVFIFEDFLADKEKVVREICDFLSIDFNDLPDGILSTHTNKGAVPFSIPFKILSNRLFRGLSAGLYKNRLPHFISDKINTSFYFKVLNKVLSKVNPMVIKQPPQMDEKTLRFLDAYFKRELEGLDDIIDKNVSDIWFTD